MLAPRSLFRCVMALGLVVPIAAGAEARQAVNEPVRIERLVGLAKLWSAIAYFHPYLAYRDTIDLDAAVTEARQPRNGIRECMVQIGIGREGKLHGYRRE